MAYPAGALTTPIGPENLSYPRGMLDRVTMVQSSVLACRETDLAVLHDALKLVHGAEPVTLLVCGEAGVGKSRLVEEFCRAATARVLIGQCLEMGEEGPQFAPFAAALRELCSPGSC